MSLRLLKPLALPYAETHDVDIAAPRAARVPEPVVESARQSLLVLAQNNKRLLSPMHGTRRIEAERRAHTDRMRPITSLIGRDGRRRPMPSAWKGPVERVQTRLIKNEAATDSDRERAALEASDAIRAYGYLTRDLCAWYGRDTIERMLHGFTDTRLARALARHCADDASMTGLRASGVTLTAARSGQRVKCASATTAQPSGATDRPIAFAFETPELADPAELFGDTLTVSLSLHNVLGSDRALVPCVIDVDYEIGFGANTQWYAGRQVAPGAQAFCYVENLACGRQTTLSLHGFDPFHLMSASRATVNRLRFTVHLLAAGETPRDHAQRNSTRIAHVA